MPISVENAGLNLAWKVRAEPLTSTSIPLKSFSVPASNFVRELAKPPLNLFDS